LVLDKVLEEVLDQV